MFKNMWFFLALCLLAVKAQTDNNVKNPETSTVKDSESLKVEPANISALYIGDLLRTKPKDSLEASGSVHRPVISKQAFHAAAPVAGRTFNYKAHGGHEYMETEYIQPAPESRSHVTGSIKRVGNTARNSPINVMGHLLTLKPVRVVAADNLPVSRGSGTPHISHHNPNEDCSKSGEHSYSSEEKPYIPEQRTYHRARQIAPSPVPEYRSPQSSYSDEERPPRYYSHSEPSSGRYDSKSHSTDSDTKSHSSGSYTRSKSTSTSKTVAPGRSKQKKARIIPATISYEGDYEKNLDTQAPSHGNQGVVVYKVTEPPTSTRPDSYSDNSERDYPPSSYGRDKKSNHREYDQYSSHTRKPVKQAGESHTPYSSNEPHSPRERPQQYEPTPYEQDRDSYEQSSYTPSEEQRYREQSKPSSNYRQESEYSSQSNSRGQEQQKPYYQNYEATETPVRYEAEEPSKTRQGKTYRIQYYERPSNEGRESTGYRKREPTAPEYSYPNQQQIQSSRSRKERPQSSYESYSSPDVIKESAPVPAPQSYERNHPSLRPSEEKPMNQYVYEATPPQTSAKHHQRSPKRQYRESQRSARSPEKYERSVIEERANLPGSENGQVVMVSRESQPYLSRSQSYSQSSYNMRDHQTPKEKVNDQEQMQSTEERQVDDRDYQTSYKPYNSEYPASYANDQHHNARDQHQSQTYQQRYEEPHSYEETPQQYQPYPEEHAHPQEEYQDEDDSSPEQGGPVTKNGKNHHYISKIEGYKDTYGYNEPLTLDEEFFRKYGISKTAKVIVASAKKPNLFVADGTHLKDGHHFADSEPTHEGSYEPDYKNNFKADSASESQEELGVPKEIPGSFDDLVDTNPKFLRKLPQIIKPSNGYFVADSSEASFDDVEFRNEAKDKGYIVSQGPREIVQQHGDGVSRILFNMPKDESKLESSNVPKVRYAEENGDRLKSSASKVAEKLLEPKS